MKKSTKKLLTLALSTLFVGAGIGGAVATYDVFNAKVAAAEEAATFVDLSSGIRCVNEHGNGDWGTHGDYKEAALYRFWIDQTWSGTCINEMGYKALLDCIIVNGKTVNEWRDAYAAGETNKITWTNMPDNGAAYPHTMQSNIAADVIANQAKYAPIFVNLSNHGDFGCAIDIYIPDSFISEVTSIEFTKGFKWDYNGQTLGFDQGVKFTKTSLGIPGKSFEHANVIETAVTGIDGSFGSADQFLSFQISTNDYGDVNTAGLTDKTVIWGLNYFDYILIDDVKLGTTWNGARPGEQFFNVWNRKNTFSTRWPSGVVGDNVQKITILAGAQFPSMSDPYNTVYEVKEDTTFVRNNDGSFSLYVETQTVDMASAMRVSGKWGRGDFAGNMAHIRLNAQVEATWTEAGHYVNNAKLPATVLDNIWVNGKSISQHNAEYKALIESGAESPITWDSSIPFSNEIADDVNNGRAIYSPIFVKFVNYGSGLAGNTIDMYIPNSYLSADEIKEVRLTKDFLYETVGFKFTMSDDVIFKSNSLCMPDKYIGEASLPAQNLTVIETTVERADGSHVDGDAFLSFYLGNSDYGTSQTPWSGSIEFLKAINYFDYILIDGVKMGTLWNYLQPSELFMNVWNRPGSFGTRWPASIATTEGKTAAKEITILAGAQFPSKDDPTGTIYEVKETTKLIAVEPGNFINEKYNIKAEDVTISEASNVGDALEMIAFDIKYANWNSERDSYDYNYFGDQFVAMRKNIFINGVSLYDINTTVDDTGYNYATGPWSNDAAAPAPNSQYQLFQNPTLITGKGDTITVYVHKDYLNAIGANTVEVTIGKGFAHSENTTYVVFNDIKANVWVRPITVSFNTNGGSAVGAFTVPYNTAAAPMAEVAAPTKEGYTFTGWTVNGAPFTAETVVTADVTVDANWEINNYAAKVVRADGSEETVEFTIENRAEKLAAIALTANNAQYTYAWATALPTELALNNDQVFTETKTVNKYTVTFDANGGTAIDAVTVPYGTPASALVEAITTKAGYTFAGWTFADGTAIPNTAVVEGDITVKATWTVITYTAKVVRADGTQETVEFTIENRAEKLAAIALTPNNAQYKYVWATALPTELALNNDQVFTETRTESVYTVTFDVNGGTAIDAVTVPYGTPASALVEAITTKTGYTFAAWTFADGTAIPDTAVVEGDITVKATWTVITYTAKVVDAEGAETTVEFTIENKADKLAEIAAMLPADTDTVDYAWSAALPTELALNNDQVFTMVAETIEQPGSSEEPGTSEQPPASEAPATSEEPSIGDEVKDMIPGCGSVVGGILGGVAALGLAATALLKKKEDNE